MIEYLLGVHILPPKKLVREIQKLSKLLNFPYKSYYGLPPHITLHLARIKENNFERLCESIDRLPKKPFTVQLTSLLCDTKSRRIPIFIVQRIHKTPPLMQLHANIVRATNAVRGGLIRTKDLKRIQEGLYTKEEIAYIRQYGYLLVMKNYMPHISLGKIDQPLNRKAQHEIRKKIQQKSSVLGGTTFRCDKMIVGLYPFDTQKGAFIPSKRIERTLRFCQTSSQK